RGGAAMPATVTDPRPHYAIPARRASDLGLGNYSISYNPGTLTVTPRDLAITATSFNKPYGTTYAFAGTEFTTHAGDLVNGNTVKSGRPHSCTPATTPTLTRPCPD